MNSGARLAEEGKRFGVPVQKLLRVSKGSRVGVFASGSPVSPERYRLGCEALEARGFLPSVPLDPSKFYGSKEHGFAADSPTNRLRSVCSLLDDPDVSALLAARGAYGTLDILPLLDYQAFARARKPVIGCSDVTALLLQVVARSGVPAIHGPTLASSFADAASDAAARESVEMTLALLSDPGYQLLLRGNILRPGAAGGRGRLLGGNLTMLLTLLGTPWDVDYRDAILVLEDVGESPFRIHRAFTQLKLAGKLDQLSGLVLGRFAKCEAPHGPTVNEVFELVARDLLSHTRYPVLSGLEFGHWGKNAPLPLGCVAEIRGESLHLLESPVE